MGALIAALLSLLPGQSIDDYLIKKLFVNKMKDADSPKAKRPIKKVSFWADCLRLACCKSRDKRTEYDRANSLLAKETNIIDIIKFQRFVKLALKTLLSKEQRHKLYQVSALSVIEIEQGAGDITENNSR